MYYTIAFTPILIIMCSLIKNYFCTLNKFHKNCLNGEQCFIFNDKDNNNNTDIEITKKVSNE